jgi:hypothetical protein
MIPPLVEVADSPEGLIEIKVRDYWGVRIGFHQIRADDLDVELVNALKAWQARHSHCCISLTPAATLTDPPVPEAPHLRCSESSPA